jgi:hypothetical protein
MTEQTKVAKATTRKTRAKTGVNTRCKKNARLISRMARNKPKPPVQLEPIAVSEDSDSEVERFLTEEYPYSEGLCDKTPCDFVENSPPYLRETLNSLVSNHRVKLSGNHQNPLLFRLLHHLVISVDCG